MSLGDVIGSASSAVSSIGSLTSTVNNLLNGGAGAGGGYFSQLRAASFRGVQFGTLSGDSQFGRRQAVHEYPNRDNPWVEDLGRAARRFTVTAFLVGDDVIAQRELLIAACETPGPGELIHPTYGSLTVSLLTADFTERWDAGRYFECKLSLIECGLRVFPAAIKATQATVASAADAAKAASSQSFLSRIGSAIKTGAAALSSAMNTAMAWAHIAQRVVNSATNLYKAVKNLSGTFGRYYGGRRNTLDSFLSGISGTASAVNSAIATGAAARQAVTAAYNNLSSSPPGS